MARPRQLVKSKLLSLGLTEVFRHTHERHPRTFPARLPVLRLDRINVHGLAAYRPLPMPRRPWGQLSDHAPLAAESELEERP